MAIFHELTSSFVVPGLPTIQTFGRRLVRVSFRDWSRQCLLSLTMTSFREADNPSFETINSPQLARVSFPPGVSVPLAESLPE